MSPSLPRIVAAAVLVSLSGLAPVSAPAMGGKTTVDAELVLAVDISYSMDEKDKKLQRAGYIAALESPEFMAAVKSGPTGRVALEYIQWSSYGDQNKVLDWSLIDSPQSAKAAADRLSEAPYRRAQRTSISGAIDAAMRDLQNNGFAGARQIIDVSGDGPNNDGPAVTGARDAAIAKGATINGLPLVGIRPYFGPADISDLDVYYKDCVIGGVGAFVIPVHNVNDFVDATRSKLVREIAWRAERPALTPVADKTSPPSCAVGESLWRNHWGN